MTANKGVGPGVKALRISQENVLFAISMARREQGQPTSLEEPTLVLCFYFGLLFWPGSHQW